MYKDGHHILHHKQVWSLRPQARQLRETPSLIPRIDRDTHEAIHASCPPIPLLGYQALSRTLSRFDPTQDTLQTMGRLQSAIEYSVRHPKAHPIEKELAQLAIMAIDLQKPYLRGNYESH